MHAYKMLRPEAGSALAQPYPRTVDVCQSETRTAWTIETYLNRHLMVVDHGFLSEA